MASSPANEHTELLAKTENDRTVRRTVLAIGAVALVVGAVVCVGAYSGSSSSFGLSALGKGDKFFDPKDDVAALLGLEGLTPECRTQEQELQHQYVVKAHHLLNPHKAEVGCVSAALPDPDAVDTEARSSVNITGACDPGRLDEILKATWPRIKEGECAKQVHHQVHSPTPAPTPEPTPEPAPTPADTDSITIPGNSPDTPATDQSDLTDTEVVGTYTTTSDWTEDTVDITTSISGDEPPSPKAYESISIDNPEVQAALSPTR